MVKLPTLAEPCARCDGRGRLEPQEDALSDWGTPSQEKQAENGGVVSFGEGSRIRTSPPHETIEAKLDLVLESFNALTATVERIAVALEKLAGK